MVFLTFFNFSLNFVIRSWWSEPQSVPGLICFCWLYRASPSLAANNIINLILILTIWWCPCVELSLVLLKNYIIVCSKAEFACISCHPIFATSPLWWTWHLGGVLVLEDLIGLHRTVQLQLLQHYWLGYILGLLWYWMVFLGNEQRSFCHFWDWTQVLHFGLFCWLWGLLHYF